MTAEMRPIGSNGFKLKLKTIQNLPNRFLMFPIRLKCKLATTRMAAYKVRLTE